MVTTKITLFYIDILDFDTFTLKLSESLQFGTYLVFLNMRYKDNQYIMLCHQFSFFYYDNFNFLGLHTDVLLCQ